MLEIKKNNLELSGDLKKNIIEAKSRFSGIVFFLLLGFFFIVLKISYLSLNNNKKFSNKSYPNNYLSTGPRAYIVDRNGYLLATSFI